MERGTKYEEVADGSTESLQHPYIEFDPMAERNTHAEKLTKSRCAFHIPNFYAKGAKFTHPFHKSLIFILFMRGLMVSDRILTRRVHWPHVSNELWVCS